MIPHLYAIPFQFQKVLCHSFFTTNGLHFSVEGVGIQRGCLKSHSWHVSGFNSRLSACSTQHSHRDSFSSRNARALFLLWTTGKYWCVHLDRKILPQDDILDLFCLLCLLLIVCEVLKREKNLLKEWDQTCSFLNLSPLSLSIMTNLIKTNLNPGRKLSLDRD